MIEDYWDKRTARLTIIVLSILAAGAVGAYLLRSYITNAVGVTILLMPNSHAMRSPWAFASGAVLLLVALGLMGWGGSKASPPPSPPTSNSPPPAKPEPPTARPAPNSPSVEQRIQKPSGTVIGVVNGGVTNNYGVQAAPLPHSKIAMPPPQEQSAMFNIHDSPNFELRDNLDEGPGHRPIANVDHSPGWAASGNRSIDTSSQPATCQGPALYSGSGSYVLIQGSTVRWSCPPATAKKAPKKPASTQAVSPSLPAASASP